MPRKPRDDVFGGGGLFGDMSPKHLPPPPDPDLALVLSLLREGPKHRDWLYTRVKDPAAVVEKLRAAGHNIKSVSWPNRSWDWVWALSENGRLCGVEGKAGEDEETAPKGKK